MYYMKKLISIILLIVGVLALAVVGARVFYSPTNEDLGLVPTSTPEQVATSEALPDTLVIPKLGISADVQHLGVTKTGLMAAPSNFTDVSWYKFGTVPGFTGSAVMAGHEDNAISLDGVFKHLEDLVEGDDVYVVRADGKRLHFRVVRKEIQPYNLSGPELEKIFNNRSGKYLNLITCTGDWLPSAKTNDKRLIVFTELVT
jgi:LPXTG-site transpeptidase (sortase) family protein